MAQILEKIHQRTGQQMESDKILIIVGPTASGKTGRAVEAALAFDGEIISADSRQIYRGMDLGTGKDLDEYGTVPYHMIDIADAGYKYNLYEYLRDCNKAIELVRGHNRLPILCGGTGLYVESVLKGIALPEVPENKALRESLAGKSLQEPHRNIVAEKDAAQHHRCGHCQAGHQGDRDSRVL